ncbi:MAG: cytochrome c-type biogenesis protein CcmH [Polyangiaceae bacterium]|nr:cytochrome c-type biogenesis protein CcmH [Polyangiaceae bacterium]
MAAVRWARYAACVLCSMLALSRRLACWLCAAVGWLAVTGAACTPTETDAQRAEAIIDHTMSPFCPGRTLASCPSPNAATWRSEIRQWTREGVSTAEIGRRIEARAGVDLSGTPEGPLGWKLPIVLAAASVAVLGLILYRLRSARSRRSERKRDPSVSPAAGNADLDRRLASELDALDDRDDL